MLSAKLYHLAHWQHFAAIDNRCELFRHRSLVYQKPGQNPDRMGKAGRY